MARKRLQKRQISPVHNIMDACQHPYFFKPWFKQAYSWEAWMAFLKVMFGLPLSTKDEDYYFQCTDRKALPTKGFKELWLVVGRRGGKSLILSLIAVYLACFRQNDWLPYLQPGERATIMIIAVDRKQARTMFRYVEGFIENVPFLKRKIERKTLETIELKRQVAIEVHTASFRTVRGYTIAACLLDEMAFFRSDEDSSNPDSEIIKAIQPAMKTIPTSMLLVASSPYARRGVLWENYKEYFGTDNEDILVWQAPTWVMNKSITEDDLADDFRRDISSAKAEYGAEFRTDVETFVRQEAVDSCTMGGRFELGPSDHSYVCFVDPSGGSQDSFTLAVAHKEGEKVILDCVREVIPPFSPEEVVNDFCDTVKMYRQSYVTGDRYGGEWPRERFDVHDVHYDVEPRTKSDLYRELLPLINSERCELLDHEKLLLQLLSLERRISITGKDSINHPSGQHDDVINAAAGALVCANTGGMELW